VSEVKDPEFTSGDPNRLCFLGLFIGLINFSFKNTKKKEWASEVKELYNE
jgi:hypothetical protein